MTSRRRSTSKTKEAGPPAKRTRGFRVIAWIEANCFFTNGEWIGKPFVLLPWERQLILELFELRPDGLRRYRWAYVSVPKKNGKTEIAAALALYLLIGDDEPSPLVICAAASDEQADLVFGAARRMAELSPTLKVVTQRFDREILVPDIPGAKLQRVAAAAGTNDGKNISAVICDELHEWQGTRGESVWNILTNGTGARKQPLVLQITTAGWDLEGTICGQQYTYARRVASGELEDPAYYSKIVEAPEGLDHRDPAVWAMANPSLGVTVQPSFLEDQLSKKSEAVFRRYFLNQWTATENFWLPQGAWEACRSNLELDPTQPLFVGLDLSLRNDATAAVSCQRQGDRIVVRPRIWENPYVPTDARYSEWRVPLGEIEVHLRELRDQFPEPASVLDGEPRPGPEFAYDPAYFRDSALRLEGDGLAMTEFPQSDGRMVPACQSLYELVVTGRIAHNGDPALTRHLSNAAAKETGRGWRLTKGRGQRGKIDGAIALAIGTHRVQTAEVVPVMVEPWVIVR